MMYLYTDPIFNSAWVVGTLIMDGKDNHYGYGVQTCHCSLDIIMYRFLLNIEFIKISKSHLVHLLQEGHHIGNDKYKEDL